MESIAFLDGLLPREEPLNDRNGEADGATEEEKTGETNDSDQDSQSGSEMDWQCDDMSEDPKAPEGIDKAHDDPSLGLFSRLPNELRDGIYDLCTQKKQYEIGLSFGPLRFQVHAPLSHLCLVSKCIASEYEARAPANALLIMGRIRRGYTFQLGDSAPKQTPDPDDTEDIDIPYDYKNTVTQFGNLNITPFEIADVRTDLYGRWLPSHVNNRRPPVPAGSFGLDLRFYRDPRSDLPGFLRVFDDLHAGWTRNLHQPNVWRVGPGPLQLHDVTFLFEGDWDSRYYGNALPVVGKLIPEGGLKFNKVLGHSEGDEDIGVERRDTEL
jgi:hypothetical protein